MGPKQTRNRRCSSDHGFRSRIRAETGIVGAETSKTDHKSFKSHHNYRRSPVCAGRIRKRRAGQRALARYQAFLFTAMGSRGRRVMILFRLLLGIYAIGNSDKPRKGRGKREMEAKSAYLRNPIFTLSVPTGTPVST